jgi:hypothetical protein
MRSFRPIIPALICILFTMGRLLSACAPAAPVTPAIPPAATAAPASTATPVPTPTPAPTATPTPVDWAARVGAVPADDRGIEAKNIASAKELAGGNLEVTMRDGAKYLVTKEKVWMEVATDELLKNEDAATRELMSSEFGVDLTDEKSKKAFVDFCFKESTCGEFAVEDNKLLTTNLGVKRLDAVIAPVVRRPHLLVKSMDNGSYAFLLPMMDLDPLYDTTDGANSLVAVGRLTSAGQSVVFVNNSILVTFDGKAMVWNIGSLKSLDDYLSAMPISTKEKLVGLNTTVCLEPLSDDADFLKLTTVRGMFKAGKYPDAAPSLDFSDDLMQELKFQLQEWHKVFDWANSNDWAKSHGVKVSTAI